MDARAMQGDTHFSVSLDDFTHLSGDKFMTSSFTKSQYNQVVFHGLSDIYPTDGDIKCTYTLTDDVKPQAGDKIALFRVGWASVSDYVTFVRAQASDNIDTSTSEVVFKAGTFEKKENELYQLCYVTSGNVIAGASTPFSFHRPHETEFVAIEDPNDPGLVVFRSRVAQLQTDLEQNNEEKESLRTKFRLLEERYFILREQFDKTEAKLNVSDEKIAHYKEKADELATEKCQLENCLVIKSEEISALKEEKNVLELSVEDYRGRYDDVENKLETLKEKIELLQLEKVNSDKIAEELRTLSNGYKNEIASLNQLIFNLEQDKVVLQNKLKKEEIDSITKTLLEKNHVSLELYQEKINEVEKEKIKVESLLQEKESVEGELRLQRIANDNLMLENRNLNFKLDELSLKHNKSLMEIHTLGEEVSDAKMQIQNLFKENDEFRVILNENTENGAPFLRCKEEKQIFQAQFENLQLHHTRSEARLLSELNETKLKYENQIDDLRKEIVVLKSKLAASNHQQQPSSSNNQRSFSQFKDPASQIFEVITDACSHVQNVFENKLSSKPTGSGAKPTETELSNGEVEKLKDKMKTLLNQKAQLSECVIQEKHKCTELEKIMKDIKEENAALKSRIAVLEYELATVKNRGNLSPSPSVVSEPLESLNKNLTEFTKLFSEQSVLEQKLQEEKNAKAFLQAKVEFLLREDADMSNRLQEICYKYDCLLKEKEELSKSLHGENLEVLERLIDNNTVTIADLKKKLDEVTKEKDRLAKTVQELRNEMIGKITVKNLAEYKSRIEYLEKELQKKKDDCFFMARFIQERFTDTSNRVITCPICPSEFPSSAREGFVQHFDNHMS